MEYNPLFIKQNGGTYGRLYHTDTGTGAHEMADAKVSLRPGEIHCCSAQHRARCFSLKESRAFQKTGEHPHLSLGSGCMEGCGRPRICRGKELI